MNQGQLDQLRRADQTAATGERAEVPGGGRMTMSVGLEAYMNAVAVNGGVDESGKTIWDDKEFQQDMARRHPHVAAKHVSRNPSICLMAPTGEARARNRFGRVSERTVYSKHGKVRVA